MGLTWRLADGTFCLQDFSTEFDVRAWQYMAKITSQALADNKRDISVTAGSRSMWMFIQLALHGLMQEEGYQQPLIADATDTVMSIAKNIIPHASNARVIELFQEAEAYCLEIPWRSENRPRDYFDSTSLDFFIKFFGALDRLGPTEIELREQ